jgi:hypothetical protein
VEKLILITVVASVILIGFTILVDKLAKRDYVKYIPCAVAFIIGAICYLKANQKAQGLEDLGYMILALINLISALCALLTGFSIDIARCISQNRKKKSKKKK